LRSPNRLAIVVRAPQCPQTRHLGRLLLDGQAYPCAMGKTGITARKREGDGATPRGSLAILAGRFRADRVHRPFGTESFWRRIKPSDGWCDASFTPAYNRPVTLPFGRSHEIMARTDHLYDRLIILDWNLSCRVHGRGSAIFLHQARSENGQMQGTEGCVALEAKTFARLAQRLAALDALIVL
jgi:L,D-peptidoglycan transpeptidase YkuD (ErfK/YbiS/YcfS/YnhG family)